MKFPQNASISFENAISNFEQDNLNNVEEKDFCQTFNIFTYNFRAT